MKKSLILALTTIVLSTAFSVSVAAADKARQDAVAERGADVMPFALDATTHIFQKTNSGGIQEVVAKSAKDTGQVRLIRAHLREIAEQFSKRDFSGPSHIHGDDMPGLAELKQANASALKVQYGEIKSGARITYTANNPELVAALHKWFDAQLSDHGHDAMEGHDHSSMHQ